jgi:hypothetical protein
VPLDHLGELLVGLEALPLEGGPPPEVMLTTSQEETDIRTSYELGANSYIVKPVHFDKFLEVVGRIDLYWLLWPEPPGATVSSPNRSTARCCSTRSPA